MRKWFNSLKVSHKLALVSIFFMMPDSVMLYMFVTSVNDNIRFARLEKMGNEYQRPLEDLLELIPQNCLLAEGAEAGDSMAREQLPKKEAQIDAAFKDLEAVNADIGDDLGFTDQGLAKRKREHYRVATVKAEWEALKRDLPNLDALALARQHRHLTDDVRVMITHAGDLSNLILDPDLDSYYLMDVTLLALPQAQDQLAEIIVEGQKVISQQDRGHRELESSRAGVRMLLINASLLKEGLDRIVGSSQKALVEDPNFYGISPSLQANLQPALEEFTQATDRFVELTTRLADSQAEDVTVEQFVAAGQIARNASFNLRRVADDELDTLLNIRIGDYVLRRSRGLIVAGCALLAAIALVTFITRSISGPLKQQAAELLQANSLLQVEIAERQKAEEAVRRAHESLEEKVIERTRELQLEIQERKEAEAKLESTHKELVVTSRLAGKAEVATGVLHNVGNVLNSVKVSATLITEKLGKSEVTSLAKISDLIAAHRDNLGEFFSSDKRGQLIPGFLADLARAMTQQREAIAAELSNLLKGVQHIKEVVSAQQSLAKANQPVLAATEPVKLLETAITMQGSSLEQPRIELARHYEQLPAILIDEHKVLQVLINLLTNATHALRVSDNPVKRLAVSITRFETSEQEFVRFQISDNGMGIAAEHLTEIFSHGFTTKKDGHGFGLHSAANAAKEMGGRLTVASDGVGKGATFALEIPFLKPADRAESASADGARQAGASPGDRQTNLSEIGSA